MARNQDVKENVNTCDTCHCIKSVRHKPHGQLQALPPPCASFTDLTMALITGISPCEHHSLVYDLIFVIVDRCTKVI